LDALLFLLVRSPKNARAAVEGMLAGIRGETGQPRFHKVSTEVPPHVAADSRTAR
jgi:hypothetical protein